MLGVVQAIASQTSRNKQNDGEKFSTFINRLMALARAQQLVAEGDAAPMLGELVATALEPFGLQRFQIDGAPVQMPAHIASSFGLLLYELATNATKYGALSDPEGMVALQWRREGNDLVIDWQERGGPPVVAPDRTGFGSRLLLTAFPPSIGNAEIKYQADGVRCAIRVAMPNAA